jgi:AraC-like DNA-binding protein
MRALRLFLFLLPPLLIHNTLQGQHPDVYYEVLLADSRDFEKRGLLDSSAHLLRQAFEDAEAQQQAGWAAAIQETLVLQLEQAGRMDELREEAEKLRAFALKNGNRAAEALTLLILSEACLDDSRFMHAMECCRKGAAICDSLGGDRLQALSRFFQGEIFSYFQADDTENNIPLYREALAYFERLADTAFMIRAHIALATGETDDRRRQDHLARARELAESYGSKPLKMRVLSALALFEPPQQAIGYLEEGLAISELLGSSEWKRRISGQLSNCHKAVHQYDQALAYLEMAMKISPEAIAEDGPEPRLGANNWSVFYGFLLALLTGALAFAAYYMFKNAKRPPAGEAAEEEAGEAIPVAPLDPDVEWAMSLQAVVERRLGEFDLKAEDIARDLGMSRTHFFRQIKKTLGVPPSQYLEEARFQRARQLLESGQVDSVKAAAYEVGFKQVKYFSKLFKERFGVGPSEILGNNGK